MKNILSIATALVMTTGAAFAQTTSQAAVLGASGNAEYPLQVQGANGVIYSCMNEVEAVNGVQARRCLAPASAGLFGAGDGLSAGVVAAAGAVALVALIANDDDDDNNTTTTTN